AVQHDEGKIAPHVGKQAGQVPRVDAPRSLRGLEKRHHRPARDVDDAGDAQEQDEVVAVDVERFVHQLAVTHGAETGRFVQAHFLSRLCTRGFRSSAKSLWHTSVPCGVVTTMLSETPTHRMGWSGSVDSTRLPLARSTRTRPRVWLLFSSASNRSMATFQ